MPRVSFYPMSYASSDQTQKMQPVVAEFFERQVHPLARDLIGRWVVRSTPDVVRVCQIVEVEAYGGQIDPASHANSDVPTPRTRSMFGAPGAAYVYLCYGVHRCFNIVARPGSRPAAVLIRAAEPVAGKTRMAECRGANSSTRIRDVDLMSGPGKLTQAMSIDMQFDGRTLDGPELYISRGESVDPRRIVATPRIGLNPETCDGAEALLWRYVDRDSSHLSRPLGQ